MISFNEATEAASRGHFSKTVSVEADIFPIALLQSIHYSVGHWPQTTSSSISFKSGSAENFEVLKKKKKKRERWTKCNNEFPVWLVFRQIVTCFLQEQDNENKSYSRV